MILVTLTCTQGLSVFAQESGTYIPFSLRVNGSCEMCKARLEDALHVKGVKSPSWSIESKLLSLLYDPEKISVEKIQKIILLQGHDLDDKKANDKTYEALPACCHYREHSQFEQAGHSEYITGVILRELSTGKFEPLRDASIYWGHTKSGVRSDSLGLFSLQRDTAATRMIISYTGFKPDTIDVTNKKQLMVVLAVGGKLTEITLISKQASSYVSLLNPIRTETMTGKELLKAACCNLSESFETNPSVDVSYGDAITGSKQIQLLGLGGNYTQLTVESLPGPRGLSTPLGLNSIAGPWIESIQLTKGTGSVVNGFESIAGQINVELKKPESAEQVLANVYTNSMGKTDLNLNYAQRLSKNWSTLFLLHDNWLTRINDDNKDGFRDLPTGHQFSAVNRYKYENAKGVSAQVGLKLHFDDRTGGANDFIPSQHRNSTMFYGLGINTRRVEGFGKLGYVFPQRKYKSIGLQVSLFNHKQDAYFGLRQYKGVQDNFYANLIYQSIIGTTDHKFRTGFSVVNDNYSENFDTKQYNRRETVPGAFFEYTYTPNKKMTLLAGLRGDNNSLYGFFFTPRFNLRYEPLSGLSIRGSFGRGQRTANIFAENNAVFASGRQVIISSINAHPKGYGLLPEIAWNKGVSVDWQFKIFERKTTISAEYFRNDFIRQVAVNLEDSRYVIFSDREGGSWSNSFQVEAKTEPVKNVEFRIAYRNYDVKEKLNGQFLSRALLARQRAFATIDYAGKTGWKYNFTVNYNGSKRIPSTSNNPIAYQLPTNSPDYWLINTQLSKSIGKKKAIDFYVGIENLIDFRQTNPILAAAAPFSPYFDASLIWGPLTGRMYYVGWRWKLKSN